MKNILFLFISAALFSGCASYNKNFKNEAVADIGFFADSTITILGDLDLTLGREDTLLVRRFLNEEDPEEQRVIELDEDLKLTLGNMVRYSIEIVNIADMDTAETNKVETYADYLVGFRERIIDVDQIDAETFDATIEEVMAQEKFVEALRKAQPLLNLSVMRAALEIEDLIDALNALALKVDSRIDEDYADIIRYRAKLEREKFDIMTAFEIIYDAYRREDPNLDELRKSGVIWTPEIIPEGRPSREDLTAIGEHLHARMQALNAVQESMAPNWNDYISTHKELDQVVDEIVLGAQRARIVMLTWVRAHQKMASGTTDPAKWFDIGEVTKSLIKSAPGAVL